MAQVNYFFSTNMPRDGVAYTAPSVAGNGNAAVGSNNSQTTTFASDALEIRISTGTAGLLTPTKQDVELFLQRVREWLYDPIVGLDALLAANSATVPIP